MDIAITIVMLVPVLLAVALIIGVIRRNVTERQAGDPVDITGAIPAVIVLMVAVLIIVAMGNAASPYVWDEDGGELTIQKNVAELDVQPWDSYASEVRSLVIEDGVTIGAGAFDSLTSLEYVSIGESVSLGSAAFQVAFKDYRDATVSPQEGVYAGYGDGTLYKYDSAILSRSGGAVGLNTAVSGVKNVVIPESIDGTAITSIAQNGFTESGIVRVVVIGDSLTTIAYRAFKNCSSLTSINIPSSVNTMAGESFAATGVTSINANQVTTLGNSVFNGCTSLSSATFEAMPSAVLTSVFYGCTSLESITIPEGVVSIGNDCFNGCTSLKEVVLPDSLTTVSYGVFAGCTGIESVTFGTGLTLIQSNAIGSWTFYESDGTTTITKTAANLAGKTFQGTAAALVEVSPGQLALTPQQIQMVQLHTQELQDLEDQISIDPLPFSPSVQTNDTEATA